MYFRMRRYALEDIDVRSYTFLGWAVENSEVELVCFMTEMRERERERENLRDQTRPIHFVDILRL